jgi:hypothetical protein
VDKWQILEGGDNENKMQNTCSHITHLEFVNKILLKNTNIMKNLLLNNLIND